LHLSKLEAPNKLQVALTELQSHPCVPVAGDGGAGEGAGAEACSAISSSSSRDAASTYCPNLAENSVGSSSATDFAAANDDIAPAVDGAAVAVAVTSVAPLLDGFTGSVETPNFGGCIVATTLSTRMTPSADFFDLFLLAAVAPFFRERLGAVSAASTSVVTLSDASTGSAESPNFGG
jgi:hypothetical protein